MPHLLWHPGFGGLAYEVLPGS